MTYPELQPTYHVMLGDEELRFIESTETPLTNGTYVTVVGTHNSWGTYSNTTIYLWLGHQQICYQFLHP